MMTFPTSPPCARGPPDANYQQSRCCYVKWICQRRQNNQPIWPILRNFGPTVYNYGTFLTILNNTEQFSRNSSLGSCSYWWAENHGSHKMNLDDLNIGLAITKLNVQAALKLKHSSVQTGSSGTARCRTPTPAWRCTTRSQVTPTSH